MLFNNLPPRTEKPQQLASYARYQSDEAVAQYCDAHYGPDKFGVANFSRQLTNLCLEATADASGQSALVLGCAVGRTVFELATHFEHVTGIDYSSRFIEIANRLKQSGKLRYPVHEEGELISDRDIRLTDFQLADTTERVSFRQGDAQELDDDLTGYNLILAANLIDRLPDPISFLSDIHERLASDGILVIASPYDWLEKYTPKKKWLGGLFKKGNPVASFDGLTNRLAKKFELIGEPTDIEFVIRKTARTYNHGISQVTVWKRL